MWSQYVFLLLAPDYDELCIPSTFQKFAVDPRRGRAAAKVIRNYFARRDLEHYNRRVGETPTAWEARLHARLGIGAEYVSPPRNVTTGNGQAYRGYSSVVYLAELKPSSVRSALILALLIDGLQSSRLYALDELSDGLDDETGAHLAELWRFLGGTYRALSGACLRAAVPPETIIKAGHWASNAPVPSFFGAPPSVVPGVKAPPCLPVLRRNALPAATPSRRVPLPVLRANTLPLPFSRRGVRHRLLACALVCLGVVGAAGAWWRTASEETTTPPAPFSALVKDSFPGPSLPSPRW